MIQQAQLLLIVSKLQVFCDRLSKTMKRLHTKKCHNQPSMEYNRLVCRLTIYDHRPGEPKATDRYKRVRNLKPLRQGKTSDLRINEGRLKRVTNKNIFKTRQLAKHCS